MEAHLTLEPEVLDAGTKPPTWLESLPQSYRRMRAFVALAIGVTIATWMAYLQWSNNVLGQVESIWLIVALAVGGWRFKVWMNKGPVRRYQSNVLPLSVRQRVRKIWPLLLVGFGGSALLLGVHWSDGMLAERWMTSLLFLPFGVLGVFICVFLKQEAVLTPEAAKLKAFYDAQDEKDRGAWADQLGEFLALKIIRYPGAALLLWAAYYFANDPKSKPWVWVVFVFWAMVAAKEVALWLLGAGFIVGVLVLGFNVLAAVPVSVAIIIGALIIAGALKK
jgi:hypothetical protein